MMRPLLAAALAIGIGTSHAHATIVTVRYDFPETANFELMWGYFGGDEPLEGQIVSTTLVISGYTTTGTQDAADFHLGFDVPTSDGALTHINLDGTKLGWSGLGSFSHTFTTDAYNGTIRRGRFAGEFLGGGSFEGESYLEFVVDADLGDPIFDDGFESEEEEE